MLEKEIEGGIASFLAAAPARLSVPDTAAPGVYLPAAALGPRPPPCPLPGSGRRGSRLPRLARPPALPAQGEVGGEGVPVGERLLLPRGKKRCNA